MAPRSREIVALGRRHMPVYALRDHDQRVSAAQWVAQGKAAAFFAGQYYLLARWDGTAAACGNRATNRAWGNRAAWFMSPREALALVERDRLHAAFGTPEAFVRLFTSLPAPLLVRAPTSPKDTLQASIAEESRADQEQEDTGESEALRRGGAGFFWMHDLAWIALADLLALYGRGAGRYLIRPLRGAPAFTAADLADQSGARGSTKFDLIISDSQYELTRAFCGVTELRLPERGDEPALLLVREGSVSAEWLAEATGWPVRVPAAVRRASGARGRAAADMRPLLDRTWSG
jgi:hypothetical protein